MNKHLKLKTNQSGVASILVTIIMMIIISLVVLGFGQLSNREQSEALDRQLSVQAYYAAESGVNDAISAVNTFIANPENVGQPVPPNLTSCNPSSPTYISAPGTTLDSGAQLSYTCLLVDPTPSSLQYAKISQSQSQVIYADPTSGSFSQLLFSWGDVQNSIPSNPVYSCYTSGTNPSTSLPPAQSAGDSDTSWNAACGAGVLRIDIVPANGLNQDTVYFLHPWCGLTGASCTADFATSEPFGTASGSVIPVNCSKSNTDQTMPNGCNFLLTDLPNGAYYLRVLPVYLDQALSISSPASGSIGVPYGTFSDGQITIDSTGKANSVLRRIKVYVPLEESGVYPDYAIQSTTSICKEFDYSPGAPNPLPPTGITNLNGCTYP
jgi:Tfp pilus assembly protein PilX